jgi:hypothetical protein
MLVFGKKKFCFEFAKILWFNFCKYLKFLRFDHFWKIRATNFNFRRIFKVASQSLISFIDSARSFVEIIQWTEVRY